MKIAVLPGDGIGPEVTRAALRVLDALGLPQLTLFEGDVGGAAYKRHGHPLPEETLTMAKEADAVLFGAVGDPDCDNLDRHLRTLRRGRKRASCATDASACTGTQGGRTRCNRARGGGRTKRPGRGGRTWP